MGSLKFIACAHFTVSVILLISCLWTFSDASGILSSIEARRHRDSGTAITRCEQTFESDKSKNGTFSSLNYPEPYPPDFHCIYTFTGKGNERVQITFTDFDLHLPHEPPRECDSVDAVMIFIIINGKKERIDNFCGNKLPAQLMSNGPSMIVEFRSLHSSQEVKGFRANYRFVTDFGITSGKADGTNACGFNFDSRDQLNGTFTSPNYPGLYPRNTECHYYFHGRKSERIRITFSDFNVDGIPPCKTDTVSDYVELSNFITADKKIPPHCGNKKPIFIESDSNFFRVTFKSNEKFDGNGFEAFYQFKEYIDPLTVKRVSPTVADNSGNAFRMLRSHFAFLILMEVSVRLMII